MNYPQAHYKAFSFDADEWLSSSSYFFFQELSLANLCSTTVILF